MSKRFRGTRIGAGMIALILLALWLGEPAGMGVDHTGAGSPASYSPGKKGIQDYQQARRVFWAQLYGSGGETLYCGEPFDAGGRSGVNIEHVFPMSWVTRALDCGDRNQCRASSAEFNRIEADLHNLYPSRADLNKARGAMRFGETPQASAWSTQCETAVDRNTRLLQPRPAARGEIARAMFYMHDIHDLEIFRAQGEMLKRWHRDDPVSAEERRRNDVIENLQGTRNPYIDNPDRANRLRF